VAQRTPTPRPARPLAFVALVLIGLYLGVALGPSQAPKLGLDLRGGTSAVMTAQVPGGKKPTAGQMTQAVDIIRNRINGNGVQSATVTTQGSNNIVVEVPGHSRSQVLRNLLQVAQLRFRLVIAEASGTATPSTSPSPSASTSPAAKKTPVAKTSSARKAAAAAVAPVKASPKASSHPTAAPTATPKATLSPAPTPSSAGSGVPAQTLFATDGPAAQNAFAELDCSKDPNPSAGLDSAGQYMLACSADRSIKYLLAPARVLGSMISSASATLDTTGTGGWLVLLNFNGKGTNLWYDLTAQASKLGAPPSACVPPTGCNEIAVVLDGVVQSAPTVTSGPISGGNTQITGNFSQTQAQNLANVLKYGALPLHFVLSTTETVSPTLGSAQLRGGLIAGAIGLGLVVLYSLLYYRGLGLITVASLALSGGLLYALITVLGEGIGYTLSLAGIAGFIVAVGITADSFVVFFERLRDAVREGRSLRSAVEFAWPRARRTILSADTVSLLAAAVLYWLSVSDVRGFAFTLGLSTACDLFIVFLFTKPLLTLVVRTKLFSSGGAFSGLAPERMGRRVPLPSDRPATEGEA
jgi:preprotein translocase subunit SecD